MATKKKPVKKASKKSVKNDAAEIAKKMKQKSAEGECAFC
jgi:hypothetical protein